MKKTLIAMAALLVSLAAYGQGTISFNTRDLANEQPPGTPAPVDAPVTQNGGNPTITSVTQLWIISGGGITTPTPLFPTTSFRTTTVGRERYVNPVTIVLDGTGGNPTIASANTALQLQMRAWDGASTFAAANTKGQSNIIPYSTGGGNIIPPALVGLTGFNMTTVPEPSVIAFGVLGGLGLLLRRRK